MTIHNPDCLCCKGKFSQIKDSITPLQSINLQGLDRGAAFQEFSHGKVIGKFFHRDAQPADLLPPPVSAAPSRKGRTDVGKKFWQSL
jgi:hypothetical protein